MSIFKPKMYKKSIFDVNYDLLKRKKIKVIIFDLDNTLAKIHERVPSIEVQNLFQKLAKDFEIVVASNSFHKRVDTFCKKLKCFSFSNMMKPTKKLYRVLLNSNFMNTDEICIIGDQILTDIVLGNRLNIKTILVDPINKDLKITGFNRFLEKRIMKLIKIKRGSYYEED